MEGEEQGLKKDFTFFALSLRTRDNGEIGVFLGQKGEILGKKNKKRMVGGRSALFIFLFTCYK